MIALTIVLAGFVLVAAGLTARHHTNRVVAALAAIEARLVEADRNRALDANVAAFDRLGVTR